MNPDLALSAPPARRSAFEWLRRLIDSPLGAVLGGACYGAWAGFANAVAGASAALHIGLTHFVMTAALTWCGVGLMNRLFRMARDNRAGVALAFCGSLTLTYSLLVGVHLLLGTPHILLTLTPGLLPTFAFTTLYSLLLLRQASAETSTGRHPHAAAPRPL